MSRLTPLFPAVAPATALVLLVVAGAVLPGTSGTYRVNVALPGGTASGTASVAVSAARIAGMEFKIPVR